MTPVYAGTALITGASSGIGAVYADRLARRGHDLILVARNADRLRAVADRLRADRARHLEILTADLTDAADIATVENELRSNARITMLVNNAGIGAVGPLLSSDVEKMDRMIALNVNALTRLTYAVVPGFVTRGHGTIINMSSIVAIAPELLNGVYGGSKAFVLAFTQSLHHEVADKGIRIQAVLPGATATEFWDLAGMSVENLPTEMVMTTESMVDTALAAFDEGELVTIPSLPDVGDWNAFEVARRALAPNLSRSKPASRYSSPSLAA